MVYRGGRKVSIKLEIIVTKKFCHKKKKEIKSEIFNIEESATCTLINISI